MTYTSNNEAMVERKPFILPFTAGENAQFSEDDLAEDRDGIRISFQRVKIPAGGTLRFELQSDDPENPDYERALEGVILYSHAACAYWQEGSEYDENSTPLCSSADGKVGIGVPGGTCETCPYNQFRSAPDGKGKACKNMRQLYFLRSGDFLPLQVSLPPTSIRPYSDFYNLAFALRNRATYGSVVQIGLRREDNGSNVYSVATFKRLYDFTGEELAQVKMCAANFRAQIKLVQQQRAAEAETRSEELEADAFVVEGEDEEFCITQNIVDGEREVLPA